jgi:hypothetical protein
MALQSMGLGTSRSPFKGNQRSTPNPYFHSDEASSFEGLGTAWLKEHDYVWHTPDQAHGIGYAIGIWLASNSKPSKVARASERVGREGVPESVTLWTERSYTESLDYWTKAKDDYVKAHIEKDYVYKPCKANEHKGYEVLAPDPVYGGMKMTPQRCQCVLPRPVETPVDDVSQAIEQRDKLLGRVPRKRGRGRPFAKGFDPRRNKATQPRE